MYLVYLLDYNSDLTSDTPVPSNKELYIYDPITQDEALMITDPVLTLEASKAGSFTCIIPQTNYGYGRIIRRLTRLVVKKNNKVIFMGRINTEDRDLYLNQEITAEGALAYLNDSLTGKKIFTTDDNSTLFNLLNYVFTNHNNKFPNEPWKQFHLEEENCHAKFVGRDDKSIESDMISYYSMNFDNSLEIVNELVSLANGVYKIEYNEEHGYWDVYIYDKNNLPITSNQPIEFGVNLLDLIQTYDNTDICSAVAPFGGESIQVSKEIGEIIAGKDINTRLGPDGEVPGGQPPFPPDTDPDTRPVIAEWYYDAISVREIENTNGPYTIYPAGDPGYGYWVFGLYIDNYNRAHPDNPLNKLYLSWRGYTFDTRGDEYAPPGYTEDCAWRIYDSLGQTLGYREFSNRNLDSDINEVIDLSDARYLGAYRIVLSGRWFTVTPIIRRDAVIVEENDLVNISECDAFEPDENSLYHPEGDFYLYSKNLIDSYGLIEQKLEYNIEDTPIKVEDWILPYSANGHNDFDFDTTGDGPLGAAKEYPNTWLGYDVGNDDPYDMEFSKGNYQILPGPSGYSCIQYRLPDVGNPNRPRGVFISTRMHGFGIVEHDGTHYKVDGMYAIFDASWYLLAFKSTEEVGFTSIKDEYIDLSDPKYFGAKYIRVGGYGGAIPRAAVPSDDTYARDRLLDEAKLYLTSYQWEKVVIEATAVDLNMVSDEWDKFDICSDVECLSNYHGITGFYLPLTSLTLHLASIEDNSIKLGYDNDEYLSNQLSENLRLASISNTTNGRRT